MILSLNLWSRIVKPDKDAPGLSNYNPVHFQITIYISAILGTNIILKDLNAILTNISKTWRLSSPK